MCGDRWDTDLLTLFRTGLRPLITPQIMSPRSFHTPIWSQSNVLTGQSVYGLYDCNFISDLSDFYSMIDLTQRMFLKIVLIVLPFYV